MIINKGYKKLILAFIIFVVFYIFGFFINNYFRPFFIIIIIIVLSNPIFNIINKFKASNKKLSAIISILLINILLFYLIFFLSGFFLDKVNKFILEDYSNFSIVLQNNIKDFSSKTKIDLNNLVEKIQNHHYNLLDSDFLKKGAVYTTDGLLTYFIGNIAAYFILVDKNNLIKVLGIIIPKEHYLYIKNKSSKIHKVLNIEIILVLISTLFCILGFIILNISNPFILGIISGLLDIIPILGIILIFLPLIIFELLNGNYIIAIGLLILYIFLQVSRQILEIKLLSNYLSIHPLFSLISIYIGLKLMGVIGIFLGLVYAILAKEIFEK